MAHVTDQTYVLGRSEREHDRLRDQARFWEPGGDVPGIHVDEGLGARAIRRDEGWPDGPFDLVDARMLLPHVDGPPRVLRRLWDRVAVGRHLVVRDYDLLTSEVVPPLRSVDEVREITLGTFRRAAGIGPPDGIEAGARVADIAVLAPMYEEAFRSLLPAAVALGLTTEARGEAWFRAFAGGVAHARPHGPLAVAGRDLQAQGGPVMTGDAEVLDVVGGRLELLTPPAATGDVPVVLRGTIPPGGFVPLHSHPDPETFIGITGVLEALAGPGGAWSPIAPGDVFHVPGGVAHAFRNRGALPATSLTVTTSALARFFREVAGMHDLREAAERHGHWLATPAQNAAIGLILPVHGDA